MDVWCLDSISRKDDMGSFFSRVLWRDTFADLEVAKSPDGYATNQHNFRHEHCVLRCSFKMVADSVAE